MDTKQTRPTHSLATVKGMDEFVITPAPNAYIVALRLSADHVAAVGHDRIALSFNVLDGGSSIGITKVQAIGEDNEPGAEIEPECHENGCYSDILVAVLASDEVQIRACELVKEFLHDVGGFEAIDACGYYGAVEEVSLTNILKQIMGE